MLGYLLRRVLAAIPVMGVVALFVFLLLRLNPGDPAAILAGDNATPAQLERIRTPRRTPRPVVAAATPPRGPCRPRPAALALPEPLYQQFFTWINNLLHGD